VDEPTVGALGAELADRIGDRADARQILSIVLGVGPAWLALNGAAPVGADDAARARRAADRRRAGTPIAYATGEAAFRHLALAVDERVLIPRPETEVLVDLVLAEIGAHGPTGGVAVDVGTGSGAIAIALATEGRALFGTVIGTDVSLDALAVAESNGRKVAPGTACRLEWRAGAALAPIAADGTRAAAVVANPPYISGSEAWELPTAVRSWEPPVALVSGADGLTVTRAIVRDAGAVLVDGGLLALEVDARRAGQVADLVTSDGRYADVRVRLDLTGRERFVLARRSAHGTNR
jgi:release factor glutamine methyltransferase